MEFEIRTTLLNPKYLGPLKGNAAGSNWIASRMQNIFGILTISGNKLNKELGNQMSNTLLDLAGGVSDASDAYGEGCKLGAGDQAACTFGAVEPSSILYNGCYILSNLTAASVVEFDYNPYYWDIANIHVPHVTVTYTNGEDPAQNFNMFVNGEVTGTTINGSLPDVVAKANELYADNIYLSDTTATSYFRSEILYWC